MSKFKKGDRVIYEGRLATIVDVNDYLPVCKGFYGPTIMKKLIWYSVQIDGWSIPCVAFQKSNELKRASRKKAQS